MIGIEWIRTKHKKMSECPTKRLINAIQIQIDPPDQSIYNRQFQSKLQRKECFYDFICDRISIKCLNITQLRQINTGTITAWICLFSHLQK